MAPSATPTAKPAQSSDRERGADLGGRRCKIAVEIRARENADERARDCRQRRHDIAEEKPGSGERFPSAEERDDQSDAKHGHPRWRAPHARNAQVSGRSHRSMRSVTSKNTTLVSTTKTIAP